MNQPKFRIFGPPISRSTCYALYSDGNWGELKTTIPLTSSITHALHYGGLVFEGMKAHKDTDGKIYIFQLPKHMKRLQNSCKRMALPEAPEELFYKAVIHCVQISAEEFSSKPGEGLYIRPFVYASTDTLGVSGNTEYVFSVVACPHFTDKNNTGKVRIEDIMARTFPGGVGTAKASGNYAAGRLADLASSKLGATTLWASQEGHLQEFTTMNLFAVRDNVLITPKITDCILSGVTRQTILDIAHKHGFNINEMTLTISDLLNGVSSGEIQEVFGSGSAVTIQQMTTIYYDSQEIPLKNASPIGSKSGILFDALENVYHHTTPNNLVTKVSDKVYA